MQYNFGVGTLIGRRTDISNPTPAFMGVLQDVELNFDQTLKELMGQYKVAVDIAPANLKITGKAKQARIQANLMNDIFFGQTLSSGAGQQIATAEQGTPSGTPKIVTVTNSATFSEDLGVFYASNGNQLERVAPAAETTGKYSVNESTGVYTFAVADAVLLNFYYRFNVTTQKQISLSNQLMGQGTSFELNLQQSYTNNAGVAGRMFIKFNACRSSKFTLPFKNTEYTIPEFDFQAFADTSNSIGTIVTTE